MNVIIRLIIKCEAMALIKLKVSIDDHNISEVYNNYWLNVCIIKMN